MKKILNYSSLMLFAFAAMFLYSCEEDPIVTPPVDEKPVVTLTSGGDLTLSPAEEFTATVSASLGDAQLKAVTVYEDGTKVPVSRLKFNGADAAANPALIVGTDKDGLTWDVSIVAQSSAATTVQYEIEVTDDNNQVQSVFVNVTTAATAPELTTTTPTTIDGLEQGSKNGFRLSATIGTGMLVSIEVRENDMSVDASRIEWDGATMMSADNPFLLDTPEQDGFEDVLLFVTLPVEEGTFIYTMIITDEYGLTSEQMFTVTTKPSGTPVELREDEVLNRDGSAPGGLDLHTGDNVSSTSAEAELVDNGIDDGPIPSNWLQTISAANGATMKYVVASANGTPEGYSFAATETKEEIEGLYTNNTGTIIDDTNSTSTVNVGDSFVVNKDGNYWLLVVKEVVVTTDNNDDKYVFDVKF